MTTPPSHLTPTQFTAQYYARVNNFSLENREEFLRLLFLQCHDQAIEMAAKAARDFAEETPPESSDWRNGERFAAGRIESRIFSLKGKQP